MKKQNFNNHISEVQEKINYRFKNADLLLQAFTRSSYSSQYGGENNEILELVGDKILDYYVIKTIVSKFGFMKSQSDCYDKNDDNDEFCIVAHKSEADFTEIKKEIVSNKTLAKRIDFLGFAKFLYLGDSDIDNDVADQEKVKADLFEAILAAIALDCDWKTDTLQNSVATMLDIDEFLKAVDTDEEFPDDFNEENSVTKLKELAEHGICSVPIYSYAQTKQDGRLMWICTCIVKSWKIQKTFLADSKKEAKKHAAYLVLCERYKK